MNFLKFITSSIIGVLFFIIPFSYQGKSTVAFDILIKIITKSVPSLVGYYCFSIIIIGAILTILSYNKKLCDKYRFIKFYKSSSVFSFLRLGGLILSAMFLFHIGPSWILDEKISKLMWNTLAYSVGVIIPVGAIFLNIFVGYGCLEFMGTLTRPLMRPLFKLPGRSSLDDLTSWLGSYSVGLYVTRRLTNQGYYTRREAFTIATCFSTVSIGFVGVVAVTLDVANLFPILFLVYFIAVYSLSAILVRMWPIKNIPDTYIGIANPEPELRGNVKTYFISAWKSAMGKANNSPSFLKISMEGFFDGLALATTILGTILTVGTAALLIYEHTELFQWLGYPLIPILKLLGIPDPQIVAPASLAGITEMYIPALIAKDASEPARFFIAALSISQLIFFSSIGPMMIDMFKDVPIRFQDLFVLFFIRTGLLIPFLALVVFILSQLHYF